MARRPPMPPGIPQYEGSPADMAEDLKGAGLLGITPQQYERHPMDRLQNIAGQSRLNAAVGLKHAANAVIKHHASKKRRF